MTQPALTTSTTVRGIPVVVHNTRSDVATENVLRRLDQSLGLIERYAPHHFRRLRRDFARIVIQRYACRGAYLPDQHTCLVELTFTVNPIVDAALAARRVAQADFEALRAPNWLKRVLARHQGFAD